MKKSLIECSVFKKQGVERFVKQSDVVRGVVEDNGPPSASYTTCPPIDVDDVAERISDDDAAEHVVDDEFDDSEETNEETVGAMGVGGDWDGDSVVMETEGPRTEVATPGSYTAVV